jgi:pyrimidine-nucleoside phosphorylase
VKPPYRAVDLVKAKRDGVALDEEALRWLVAGYLDTVERGEGQVSEGQMGAFLMAGVLQGFTEDEALALTRVLVDSGDVLDLTALRGPTIDKHSTGGVGDGTTLLVAPLLAAAGAQFVKLAGRGLGHTGGTLDKLEAIPGFRVDLPPDEVLSVAAQAGCVVAAQTDRLVPADRALYGLRDVTATVESTALIASSVMSKKLAAGAESIVLDVKAGSGAFMATVEEAALLAWLCVRIGVGAGRRCIALVTAMDEPLGRQVGNALEVREAVRLLSGAPEGRLAELSLELAVRGLVLATEVDAEDARAELLRHWSSGEALARLTAMIAAQGGDPAVCEAPDRVLPQAPVRREVVVGRDGVVAALPARGVGEVVAALGAGRARAGDPVDSDVGVEVHLQVGDRVEAGTPFVTIHARDEANAERAEVRLRELLTLRDRAVLAPPTVLDVVA